MKPFVVQDLGMIASQSEKLGRRDERRVGRRPSSGDHMVVLQEIERFITQTVLQPLHRRPLKRERLVEAIVKSLHSAGADANAKDNDGYTPLVKATEQKKTAVVNYLKLVIKK